ncbi:MAG: hypothetical protein DRI71_08680, partial [Bacteroidetes bacterium]
KERKIILHQQMKQERQLVILQANSISHIDSTAYLALVDLILELEEQQIKLYLSNLIGPTRDFLERSGIDDVGEKEKSFVDVDTAINHFDQVSGRKG